MMSGLSRVPAEEFPANPDQSPQANSWAANFGIDKENSE